MHFCVFGAGAPGVVPVDIGVRARGRTDNFKHPFGRVSIRRTGVSAVAFKVLSENVGVVSYFSEIDCSATFGEEKESVESLEEHGRWLMDLNN